MKSKPTADKKTDEDPNKKTWEKWLGKIAAAEKLREERLPTWQENVRKRLQKRSEHADVDSLSLPEDWARTKQKSAQLNYQLPKILAKAKHPSLEEKAAIVTADINDTLRYECKASYCVDECMADGINASGALVAVVGMERQTETFEIDVPAPPTVDPLGTLIPSLEPPRKEKVTRVIAQKFTLNRLSTANLLWPAEFTGSNWDLAPWLGEQQFITVEQARKTYPKLPKDFEATGARPKALSGDVEKLYANGDEYVKVTTLWYYAWLYDADKQHPECIRKIVFVDGHPEPVEFGETDWQEWVPEEPGTPAAPDGSVPAKPGKPGYYKGLRRLPIRVETLVYVSDVAIPPSDTEAGSVQVRELTQSRSQMIRQRNHAIPMRWFNTNLVDEEIADQVKSGRYQDIIPVNGDGSRTFGEVARANYPRESFQFQSIIGNDLDRAWALSNNQLSQPNAGEKSAKEVGVIQSAGQIRLDYEKGRVNRWLVEICEVLFSLMQKFRHGTKYVTVPTPEGDVLQSVEPSDLQGEFMFDFVADTSDRVDLATKQANVLKVWNIVANESSVDRRALVREVIEVNGMDPNRILLKKEPEKSPEPPNISFRFSGEDLLNPMVVVLMQKGGYVITPEEIKAASLLIQDAVAQIGFKHPQPGPGQPAAGGPPQPEAPQPLLPAEAVQPILKRAADGSRF